MGNEDLKEVENIRLAQERLAKAKMERELREKANKSERKNKKCGKFTKAAGIISTVFFSCYMLLTVISLFSGGTIVLPSEIVMNAVLTFLLSDIIPEAGVITVIAVIFTLAYMIVCLIFATQLISFAGRKLKELCDKRAALITYMSFFGAWLVVPISLILNGSLSIAVLSIAVIIMCIAFVIIDIIAASKEYTLACANEPAPVQTAQFTNNEQPNTQKDSAQNILNIDTDKLKAELLKVKKLLDDGLIDEDEYKILRENILRKG